MSLWVFARCPGGGDFTYKGAGRLRCRWGLKPLRVQKSRGTGMSMGNDGDVAAAGVGDADDGLRGVAEQLPAPLGRPVCRRPCPRIGGSSSPMTRGIAQPSDAAGDAGGFEQQVEGAVRGGGRTGSGSRCGKVGRSRSPFRSKLPESWRTWGLGLGSACSSVPSKAQSMLGTRPVCRRANANDSSGWRPSA